MKTRKNISQKVLLSAAAVTTAVGLAGAGTLATWSKTVADTHTVTAGEFGLGAVNAGGDATNFVPGDSMQRLLTISHEGNVDYASLVLTTTASEALDLVDASDDTSLRIAIDRCGQAWTQVGSTFTCVGGATSVVATTDVLGSWDLAALTPASPAAVDNGVDNLRVTVSLPSGNNDYVNVNGESVGITYTVVATQRGGVAK